MKNKKLKTIGIITLILFIAFLILTSSKSTTNPNFYSSEFGLIESKIVECNFGSLCKYGISGLLSQNYYADKSQYNVGESITGKSAFSCVGSAYIPVTVRLVIDTGTMNMAQSASTTANNNIKYLSWSIPTSTSNIGTGSWKIYDCWKCQGAAEYCSGTSYAASVSVVKTTTSCPADVRNGVTSIWPSSIGNPVGLEQYRADAYDHYTLSGGSCIKSTVNTNWVTSCISGFTCDGTNIICSGKGTCTKTITSPTTECSSDLTSNCPDGSSIVTKICNNGFFASTGATCTAQTNVCPSGTTGTYPNCASIPTQTCPSGTTGTYPSCVSVGVNTCPSGTTGTYPNCASVGVNTCPSGTTGTYPSCISVITNQTVIPSTNETGTTNNAIVETSQWIIIVAWIVVIVIIIMSIILFKKMKGGSK